MPWAYILECADGSFYVGSTTDLDRRVGQHNDGLGAAYTRRQGRRPVRLVWAADFHRKDEAFAFEKRIAGWSRKKKLALIEDRRTCCRLSRAERGGSGTPATRSMTPGLRWPRQTIFRWLRRMNVFRWLRRDEVPSRSLVRRGWGVPDAGASVGWGGFETGAGAPSSASGG
jgi:putative endonuclease